MRTALSLALLLAIALLAGCASLVQRTETVQRAYTGDAKAPVMPPPGWVWTDHRAPVRLGPTSFGSKGGRATSHLIGLPPLPLYGLSRGFPLFAWGDASEKRAAAHGGITKVEHVDYRSQIFVFVYKRFTTEVYGD